MARNNLEYETALSPADVYGLAQLKRRLSLGNGNNQLMPSGLSTLEEARATAFKDRYNWATQLVVLGLPSEQAEKLARIRQREMKKRILETRVFTRG